MAEQRETSTIWVVDSRPEDYVSMLADPDCEGQYFRFFHSAGAALRAGRDMEPSLWIINMDLPDLGGVELCEMLRGRFSEVPMYLVCDDYDAAAELGARRCGATMFFSKPASSQWILGHDVVMTK